MIAEEYMFCPECGVKNESNFKYCPNCGFEIGKIHLNYIDIVNQNKETDKLPNFPSEIWSKLIIKKEEF
jgi:uncharacterized membrane protein YvbJ